MKSKVSHISAPILLGLSVLAIALLLSPGEATPAGAQSDQTTETLMVSNLDKAAVNDLRYEGRLSALYGRPMAQSFCTGDTEVTLTKVHIPTRTTVPQHNETRSVTIRADSSGNPGDTLHTLTKPPNFDDSLATDETFTTSGYNLAANSIYWLVVETPQKGDYLMLGTTWSQGDSSAEAGWSIGSNLLSRADGRWEHVTIGWRGGRTEMRMRMAVHATGNSPSPLPASLLDRDCDDVADPLTFRVDEHAAVGTFVGRVLAGDPNNDSITYSVSGREVDRFNDLFTINASTGRITCQE